jgi:hypothetical protein
MIAQFDTYWRSLPELVRALILLPGGPVLAILARLFVSSALGLLQLDRLSAGTVLGEFLRKGRVAYTPSRLLGFAAFWICLGWVELEVVRLLDPELASALGQRLHDTTPGLIAALLLFVLGLFLIVFLANLAGTIMVNAGFALADSVTRLLKFLGVLVVVVVALEQVSIGGTLLGPLVLILFASLSFGVALAFGLGCKDIARDAALRAIAALREKQRAPRADLEG